MIPKKWLSYSRHFISTLNKVLIENLIAENFASIQTSHLSRDWTFSLYWLLFLTVWNPHHTMDNSFTLRTKFADIPLTSSLEMNHRYLWKRLPWGFWFLSSREVSNPPAWSSWLGILSAKEVPSFFKLSTLQCDPSFICYCFPIICLVSSNLSSNMNINTKATTLCSTTEHWPFAGQNLVNTDLRKCCSR